MSIDEIERETKRKFKREFLYEVKGSAVARLVEMIARTRRHLSRKRPVRTLFGSSNLRMVH